MKYKLTIIKYEDNENYEKEMAEYKENFDNRRMYGGFTGENTKTLPNEVKAIRALEVILTDEEYVKVKAEVIKIFE